MFIERMQRFCRLVHEDPEPPRLATAGRLARGAEIPVAEYLWLDDYHVLGAIDCWQVAYVAEKRYGAAARCLLPARQRAPDLAATGAGTAAR